MQRALNNFMKFTKRFNITLTIFIYCCLSGFVIASDAVLNPWDKAIQGYDPVAYFKQGEPTLGKQAFSYQYNKETWHFSSQKNKDDFIANPVKYAPQYGNNCAYAVSRGYTASVDPQAWHISDGKLYLNYNKATRVVWLKNKANNITKADKNWPRLLNY